MRIVHVTHKQLKIQVRISLTECSTDTIQKYPFGVNSTIELKTVIKSENTGTFLSRNIRRWIPVLSDLVVYF